MADLRTIAEELDSRERTPGWSIPGSKVEEAMRAVVRTHPVVRRLVEDFDTARRTFQQYEATLIWLAARDMIPEDLIGVAPSRNATRFAEPGEEWTSAVEALRRDCDALLPG